MPTPPNPEHPTQETNPIKELIQKTEAEATLLFDEADSLFTKRSDGDDSHDRYKKD